MDKEIIIGMPNTGALDVTNLDKVMYCADTQSHLMVCLCEKSCCDGYVDCKGLAMLCEQYGVAGILLYYRDENGDIKPIKLKSK